MLKKRERETALLGQTHRSTVPRKGSGEGAGNVEGVESRTRAACSKVCVVYCFVCFSFCAWRSFHLEVYKIIVKYFQATSLIEL